MQVATPKASVGIALHSWTDIADERIKQLAADSRHAHAVVRSYRSAVQFFCSLGDLATLVARSLSSLAVGFRDPSPPAIVVAP